MDTLGLDGGLGYPWIYSMHATFLCSGWHKMCVRIPLQTRKQYLNERYYMIKDALYTGLLVCLVIP